MKILVIVNESPWGSSLVTTALRFVQSANQSGHKVPAVFFQNDGSYNAFDGRVSDDGMVSPSRAWQEIGREHHTRLLLCSAAFARRFMTESIGKLPEEFREAGLPQMWDIARRCDRVVSF